MHVKLKRRTDITVESFAYVARKLAQSLEQLPINALYEQILGEAEKRPQRTPPDAARCP